MRALRLPLLLAAAAAALVAAPRVWSERPRAHPVGEPLGPTVAWPLDRIREPSGVVYHPGRRTLFVVGDEGDVAEVGLDGKLIATRVLGGDLEGVTCDPASGLVYVVREGHEILFELDPDTLKPRRRFLIDRSFGGDPNFLRRGGDGIEGLTFVPSKSDPEGGRFYAVNQYDPPVLVELRVPLRSSQDPIAAAEITGAWPLGPAPLSGVTWDPPTGVFLVPSALWHSALVVSRSGTKLGSVRIPGFMQEGITRVPGGSFVIAQDSGGLVKWTPPRDPFAEALRSRGSVGQDRSGNGHEGKPD